jgi:hypothetical protein
MQKLYWLAGQAMHPSLERTDHRPWALPSGPWRWRQNWHDLLFAHWRVPASRLQSLVPAGVSIQEFDGTAWVGVVPFRMDGVMLRPLPDLPGVSAFPELNLRLYVEVGGRPGVWFVSLDAASQLAVWAARLLFRLPYFHATMHLRREGERIHYRSIRRSARNVAFRGTYWPVGQVFESRPGTVEHFLTERYCLYTCGSDGSMLRADVHHRPWPLQLAHAEIEENTIGSGQGIDLDDHPDLLHFSKRIDVVVWPAERCAQTAEVIS